MLAPVPYFGGKRSVATEVWERFGDVDQYIEPFCGSAAILLAAPSPASLEVIGDMNGFIANFWRSVRYQPASVAEWADYPVSHIDLGARHTWLMEQRERLAMELHDCDWPGDPKAAGWWLWGQCAWIGSGWCEWDKPTSEVPSVTDAGQGIQAIGKIPHVIDTGRGIQAIGQIPHVTGAGQRIQRENRTAWVWIHKLAQRLDRVRAIHGNWTRCLNHHYGKDKTAIFFDPPYKSFESLYGVSQPIAGDVEAWAREHPSLHIALCGHIGDYDLPGWDIFKWSRSAATYGSIKTKTEECIWFSPGCLPAKQMGLFNFGDAQ